jgi:hypothetical protein
MQPHYRRLSGRIVDGNDVEPHLTFFHRAFAPKGVSGAHQHLVLRFADA